MKVLLVEDEAIVSIYMESVLEGLGESVVGSAVSARQAREILEREKPELVFLDIFIQGDENGIELARSINEKYPSTKIVFVTANTDDATRALALETRHLSYLDKPLLEHRISQVLELARTSQP